MLQNRFQKGGIIIMLFSFLGGCAGTPQITTKGISQEKLILREQPFIDPILTKNLKPTVFLKKEPKDDRAMGAIGGAIIASVAPRFIEKGVDVVGKAVAKMAGKDQKPFSVEAQTTNFFFKGKNYHFLPIHDEESNDEPSFSLIFMSGRFGDTKQKEHSTNQTIEKWKPSSDALNENQSKEFNQLHLIGEPSFYLEAKVFPLPGNYIEIAPTYMFYNRPLGSSVSDKYRDLALDFTLYEIEEASKPSVISHSTIPLKDVAFGTEYHLKDFASARTGFMKIPNIDASQEYSGAFMLQVKLTETKDLNEWLAALGDAISESKDDIANSIKPYVSKKAKIEAQKEYQLASIEVEIAQANFEEAQEQYDKEEITKAQFLEFEKKLIEKKAELDTARLAL